MSLICFLFATVFGICIGAITMVIDVHSSSQSEKYVWSPESPYDCNFDTDFCGWKNETDNKIVWERAEKLLSKYETGSKIGNNFKINFNSNAEGLTATVD